MGQLSNKKALQAILDYLAELGKNSIFIRALYGALATVAAGVLLSWLAGSALVAVVTGDMEPLAAELFKIIVPGPIDSFLLFNGAPGYARVTMSAMMMEETIGITRRTSTLIFLIIPFLCLFSAAFFNVRHSAPRSDSERLQLALAQGVFYGLILALFSIFISWGGKFDLDTGMGTINANYGYSFFGTLFVTTTWGCLLSVMGAFYPRFKFNYGLLLDQFDFQYKHGPAAAIQVIKITLLLALFFTAGAVLVLILTSDEIAGTALPAGIYFTLPFAYIQALPMVALILKGAPFEASAFGEGFYLSLWRGYGMLPDTTWPWFFLVLLFIPLALSFYGGHISQKLSPRATEPWKGALYYSLAYSALSFLLVLISHLSIRIDAGGLLQMLMNVGGINMDLNILVGFALFPSLLSVFILSFIPALIGAYHHGPSSGLHAAAFSKRAGAGQKPPPLQNPAPGLKQHLEPGAIKQALLEKLPGKDAKKAPPLQATQGFTGVKVPIPQQVPSLVGIRGQFAGRQIDLCKGRVVIGRDPGAADLVYASQVEDISRKHCVVSFDPVQDRFIIEDYSTNGTYLGAGERLEPARPRTLNDGEQFYLSSPEETFKVCYKRPAGPPGAVKGANETVNAGFNAPVPGGEPVLVGIKGTFAGQKIPMGHETVTIGRDPTRAHLVYPLSADDISRRHCTVRYDRFQKVFILEDSSTNGTYTENMERLQSGSPQRLQSGTRIHLSSIEETFELRLE